MLTVNSCIVCKSQNLFEIPAKVTPFISEYVFNTTQDISSNLLLCKNCGFCFYNIRFDDSETLKLYSDYRGETYVKVREKYEPEYADIKDKVGNNEIEIINRKNNLQAILEKYCSSKTFTKILDWGGDAGQFIPDFFRKSLKYVYDISKKPPRNDVMLVTNPSGEAPFDFVMCCHVLEHTSDPITVIKQITQLTKNNGIIYFEVPHEAYIMLFRYYFNRLNLPILKKYRDLIPQMHEHINCFSVTSLINILKLCGLRILYIKKIPLDLGWIKVPVISALVENSNLEVSHLAFRNHFIEFFLETMKRVGKKIIKGTERI